jgi:hypothetical protein
MKPERLSLRREQGMILATCMHGHGAAGITRLPTNQCAVLWMEEWLPMSKANTNNTCRTLKVSGSNIYLNPAGAGRPLTPPSLHATNLKIFGPIMVQLHQQQARHKHNLSPSLIRDSFFFIPGFFRAVMSQLLCTGVATLLIPITISRSLNKYLYIISCEIVLPICFLSLTFPSHGIV